MTILNRIKHYFKNEPMLLISLIIVAISMFFVPPSESYLDYIDFRVICLLFCLIAVVLGFQECGLFTVLAKKLLSGKKQFRTISIILILLPFFSSMIITNEVALIAFVPFTIIVMDMIGRKDALIKIVVFQTIAANLGSIATPFGKPQNLFLYEFYKLSSAQYFNLMIPLVIASFIAVCIVTFCFKNEVAKVTFESKDKLNKPKKLYIYIALFALCMLSVFRILNYLILTAIIFSYLLLFSRNVLKKIDYSLLLTFICFFIFAGNIGQISEVRSFLTYILDKSTMLSAIIASQIISNVSASVLLSGFTEDWANILLGVNIGGLGTPIASLSSLISLRIYLNSVNAKPLSYLGVFAVANAVGIIYLLTVVWLIY